MSLVIRLSYIHLHDDLFRRYTPAGINIKAFCVLGDLIEIGLADILFA